MATNPNDNVLRFKSRTPSLGDGLPDVGTATQAEFDAARTRLQQARPAGSTSPTPAGRPGTPQYNAAQVRGTAGPSVTEVGPSALTPAEQQAFARQARPALPQVNEVSAAELSPAERASLNAQRLRAQGGAKLLRGNLPPDVAAAQARTNMGAAPRTAALGEGLAPSGSVPAGARVPVMQRVGGAVRQVGDAVRPAAQRAARLGASPVESAGSALKTGLRDTGVGLLAAEAIGGANAARQTDTADYYRRYGIDPQGHGIAADLGIRGLGVAEDVGNHLIDGLNNVGTLLSGGLYQPGSRVAAKRYEDDLAAGRIAATAPAGGPAPAPAAPAAEPQINLSNGLDLEFAQRPAGNPAVAAARQSRIDANDGIVPVADRAGSPDEVIGTINGRAITRGESDALAKTQSFGGPTQAAPALGEGLQPARSGGAVSAGSVGGGAEARLRDIGDPATAAGKLYAQLAADKTPTGKRVAAEFLQTYLNGGTAERGQDAGLNESAIGASASMANANTAAAADLERTRAAKRAPQYMTAEDGTVSSIVDGLAAPVLDAKGQPLRAGAKSTAAITTDQLLGRLNEMVGRPSDYADYEEYTAAREKARAQLMAELNGGKTDSKKDQ